jgi:lipopolysaccharide biosynthesis protein
MGGLLAKLKDKKKEENLIFLKSWNEWGEGNYMEPDLKYGNGFLDALQKVLKEDKTSK